LSLYVSPWCADLQFELQARARKDAELTMFVPGTFREINGGQQVVYVSAVEDQGKELRKVFIQSQLPDGVAVTTGERGHQQIDAKSGARYIVLNDGYRYEGTPGKGDYQSVHFRRAAMRIESAPAEQTWQRREAIPSSELFHSTTPSHAAELQKRFSKPLSLFLLAVLAPLLARAQPREGRYGRLVAAILIYSIYANLLEIAEAWLAHGRVWSPLGLWWVHALVLATGAGLWVSQYGFFGLSSARKR
jgi:lipopolysaccharide export system permease protein